MATHKNAVDAPNAADPNLHPSHSGVSGAKIKEPQPKFIKADHETDLSPTDINAWIILGRDRVASRGSGYSGTGDSQCAAIDLCVGRMAARPQDDVYVDPVFVDKGPSRSVSDLHGMSLDTVNALLLDSSTDLSKPMRRDWTRVSPNRYKFIHSDAARIYISQKTDIDRNFRLESHHAGVSESTGKSGIGIKADAVRIIGREGIKLVTTADLKNSQGGKLNSQAGIDLIAGNNVHKGDYTLEPLVKGKKLVDCIAELTRKIEELGSQLNSSLKTQMEYNMIIATHNHNSPFYGMTTNTSIAIQPGSVKASVNHLQQNVTQLKAWRQNMSNFRSNYLLPSGGRYINSKWNRTN